MRAALLLSACLAFAASQRFTLESRSGFPTEWTQLDRADPKQTIKFDVALAQQNLAAFDERFWAISTPGTCVSGHVYCFM